MVICTYSVHITMVNFSPLFSIKIDSSSAQLAPFMLENTLSASSNHLFYFGYNIFLLKCFIVTSLHSDENVPWLYIHPSVYITMAKFSPVFQHEMELQKYSIRLMYVGEEMQFQIRPVICLKVQYFCS